ncbi:MAG: hypothetical protein ACP5U2_17175 [Bryobacteraceae bacterium]
MNEYDGRAPGLGNYPFCEFLLALRRIDYRGWLSVDLFDFAPGGETLARQAFRYLASLLRTLR